MKRRTRVRSRALNSNTLSSKRRDATCSVVTENHIKDEIGSATQNKKSGSNVLESIALRNLKKHFKAFKGAGSSSRTGEIVEDNNARKETSSMTAARSNSPTTTKLKKQKPKLVKSAPNVSTTPRKSTLLANRRKNKSPTHKHRSKTTSPLVAKRRQRTTKRWMVEPLKEEATNKYLVSKGSPKSKLSVMVKNETTGPSSRRNGGSVQTPPSPYSPSNDRIKRSQRSILNQKLKIQETIHHNHKKRYAALQSMRGPQRKAISQPPSMRLASSVSIKEEDSYFPLFESKSRGSVNVHEYAESVEFIESSNQCITKVIGTHLEHFAQLSSLDLFANNIKELDESIGELGNTLMYLSLSYNKLRQLPRSLNKFHTLTTLLLSNNQLCEIPEEIGSLVSLRHLEMNDNYLKDVPASIGGCRSLVRLELANNHFDCLPSTIAYLPSLEVLILSNNKIEYLPGVVPACCQRLRVLCLMDNCLEKLPVELGYLRSLQILRVQRNPLHLETHAPIIDFVIQLWRQLVGTDVIPVSRKTIWNAINISSLYGNLILPTGIFSMNHDPSFISTVPLIIVFAKWMQNAEDRALIAQPHFFVRHSISNIDIEECAIERSEKTDHFADCIVICAS